MLAGLLALSPARAQEAPPAPGPVANDRKVPLWEDCHPALDVRGAFRLEAEGARAPSMDVGLDSLATPDQRAFAAWFWTELCRPEQGPLQRLARFVRVPVTVRLDSTCGHVSQYTRHDRTILMEDFPSCRGEVAGTFLHELGHVVFSDLAVQDARDYVEYVTHECHDDTIYDTDRTLLLAMDARTSPLRALDEGFATAVSVALGGHWASVDGLLRTFRTETGSVAWRRKSWQDQQSNEYFVALVLAEYLGREPASHATRLALLVRAVSQASPDDLRELLLALAEADPVRSRGRVQGILESLQSNWDYEREEISRERRRQGRD